MAKKKFVRVASARAPMVEFTLPEIYGDAVFELPDADRIPVGVATRLKDGDLSALDEWFTEAGVPVEVRDAVNGLSGSEFEPFIEAWNAVSSVDIPKSGN